MTSPATAMPQAEGKVLFTIMPASSLPSSVKPAQPDASDTSSEPAIAQKTVRPTKPVETATSNRDKSAAPQETADVTAPVVPRAAAQSVSAVSAAQGPAKRSHRWQRLTGPLPPIITTLLLLLLWQVGVSAGHVPATIIPSPAAVLRAGVRAWPTLGPALAATSIEALAGFAIAIVAGIALGVAFHCSSLLHRAFLPLFTGAQAMPLIAVAPLFLLWFGFEMSGKIVIVAVFSVFPVLVQTTRGLDAVPRFYEDVALTCGASKAWTLWHVKLRVAGPQVFSGIRIAAAYVFSTATTAEYLGARRGLGIWLQMAYNSFQTPLVFVAALVIVVVTLVLMGVVSLVERLMLGDPADFRDM